jgi:hypothetical protein
MIPESVSTHSKLLLPAQGFEFAVQFCEWFPLVGLDEGVRVAAPNPSICEIGPRVTVLDPLTTTHSKSLLPAQGVESKVHD